MQYGPRVKALGVYLLSYQLLPYPRIAGLFADLFDAPLSPGTLCTAQQTCASGLSDVLCKMRNGLQQAPVVHFDETGGRLGGKLHWLPSAATATLTSYAWHEKRGKVGIDAAGILPHFTGIAVHDGWASYQYYACHHALCNAHHLRELMAMHEADKQDWVARMRSLLVEINKAVARAKETGANRLSSLLQCRFEVAYRKLLGEGLAQNPPLEILLLTKRGRPSRVKPATCSCAYNRKSRRRWRLCTTLPFPSITIWRNGMSAC